MKNWQFTLETKVSTIAGEKGTIIGRAEYTSRPDLYYVAYVGGNGCAQKDWFQAEELTAE